MTYRPAVALALLAFGVAACSKDKRPEEAARATSASAPLPSASVSADKRPPLPPDAIAETGAGVVTLLGDDTRLYWLSSGYKGSTKGVVAVPKAGGAPKRLAGVDQAIGLWATTRQLYYYDAGQALIALPKTGNKGVLLSKGGVLGAAGASGDTFCWVGAPTPAAVAAPDPSEKKVAPPKVAKGNGSDLQRTKVFESDKRSVFCRKDGEERTVTVAPTTMFNENVLVADDRVYWPSSLEGTIQAAPVGGSAERTLVRGVRSVSALAANAASLYFIGAYRNEIGLFALGKQGGVPRKLTLTASSADLAVDETDAYYALGNKVWRVPVRGGTATPFFHEEGKTFAAIVLDESFLYLADGLYLRRLPKAAPPSSDR